MTAISWTRSAWVSIFALAGLCAAGSPAFAVDELAAEFGTDSSALDRRWIPSFSIFTMGGVDQRAAQMSSADTSVVPSGIPLDRDGESRGIPWTSGVTLDIASPVILDLPGRPRLFAHADIAYTYDLDDPVVSQGDPGEPPFLPETSQFLRAIENVGASVRVEGKPLTFSGGFGTVFSFEAMDRGFRVRPTLEWMYRRDTMKNVLASGENEIDDITCGPCRLLFVKSQTEKGFHSLGPGIELEADVGRAGDFMIGMYGAFRAYYLVGDRKANLRSTGSWRRLDDQPTTRADSTLVSRYEREPWHYRFGVGFRVLWSPEE